jgi:hypothetical protein
MPPTTAHYRPRTPSRCATLTPAGSGMRWSIKTAATAPTDGPPPCHCMHAQPGAPAARPWEQVGAAQVAHSMHTCAHTTVKLQQPHNWPCACAGRQLRTTAAASARWRLGDAARGAGAPRSWSLDSKRQPRPRCANEPSVLLRWLCAAAVQQAPKQVHRASRHQLPAPASGEGVCRRRSRARATRAGKKRVRRVTKGAVACVSGVAGGVMGCWGLIWHGSASASAACARSFPGSQPSRDVVCGVCRGCHSVACVQVQRGKVLCDTTASATPAAQARR